MKKVNFIVIAAALAALAGCAAEPQLAHQQDPNCVATALRPIGPGQAAAREVCVAWVFGPTRTQRAEFDRRAERIQK